MVDLLPSLNARDTAKNRQSPFPGVGTTLHPLCDSDIFYLAVKHSGGVQRVATVWFKMIDRSKLSLFLIGGVSLFISPPVSLGVHHGFKHHQCSSGIETPHKFSFSMHPTEKYFLLPIHSDEPYKNFGRVRP